MEWCRKELFYMSDMLGLSDNWLVKQVAMTHFLLVAVNWATIYVEPGWLFFLELFLQFMQLLYLNTDILKVFT